MSDDNQRARTLFQTLNSKGFKRDRAETSAHRYTGILSAAGREISVAITFSNLEFTRLPDLTLLNPDQEAPYLVAHLAQSGALCFARNEDLVLNRYDVGGTALMCLELARQGLERVLTHKHLEQEIAQEFPQHWLGDTFYYDIAATACVYGTLHFVPRDSSTGFWLLTDREEVLRRLTASDTSQLNNTASSQCAFVFYLDTDLTFSQGHRQPCTLADFIVWLENTAPNSGNRAITELTRYFPGPLVPLFVNAPNGCVGIEVDASLPIIKAAQRPQGLRRIFDDNAERIEVHRYSGKRIDFPFIFERNMNRHAPLTAKRIALVGCGTIGSHLGKLLTQSGAGHEGGTLLLLDNQLLEPANIGRHYLGATSIGESKSRAFEAGTFTTVSWRNIVSMSHDAVGVLESLSDYDLVVDATGEEALSLSINHHFVERRCNNVRCADVLHVWLFGDGAAAQALLVNSSRFACFKCLKPDLSGNWRFSPLKGNTQLTKTAAACGEAQYIAYGVAAPTMAAALALQVILDWNSGTPTPRLRTVRIEKRDTREVADKNPRPSPRCPACAEQYPQGSTKTV